MSKEKINELIEKFFKHQSMVYGLILLLWSATVGYSTVVYAGIGLAALFSYTVVIGRFSFDNEKLLVKIEVAFFLIMIVCYIYDLYHHNIKTETPTQHSAIIVHDPVLSKAMDTIKKMKDIPSTQTKKILNMAFDNGTRFKCEQDVVSKADGWTFDEDKFVKGDKRFSVWKCDDLKESSQEVVSYTNPFVVKTLDDDIKMFNKNTPFYCPNNTVVYKDRGWKIIGNKFVRGERYFNISNCMYK